MPAEPDHEAIDGTTAPAAVDLAPATTHARGVAGQAAPHSAAVEDDADELSFPFSGWLRAAPGRPVIAIGYALIAFQLALRGWVKSGGWFLGDDFSFMARAFTMPLWSSQYLLEGWHGHFMPGAFIQVKVFALLWPYDYLPVALFDLLLQGVVSFLALRLLLDFFGPRTEILIPFTIFLLSPITLPAFLWWAAALNQLWGQLAMILVLGAHLRYHRTGKRRYIAMGVAAMAFGLLFSEKALLIAPLLAAMTLLWGTPGAPLTRIRRALRENAAVWVSYGVLVAAYVIFYKAMIPAPSQGEASMTVAIKTVGTGLMDAVIPAMFGGPYTWYPIGFGGTAAPPRALVIIFLMATGLLVWFSLWRAARASFGWWVILGYHVTNTLILGLTRASWVGPIIGAEYRYHTDLAIVISLFGTMAFLPVIGTFSKGTYQPLRFRGRARREATLNPGIVGTILTLLIVGSSMSTLAYDDMWRVTPMKTYFTNVERSIQEVDRPITIADYATTVFGYTNSPRMFSAMEPKPTFLTKGTATDIVFTPDEEGHLRLGEVQGFKNKPGPEEGCGWRLERTPSSIPLDLKTIDWMWTVRISYIATYDNDITVTAGRIETPVHLPRGVNTIHLLAEGAIDRINFSGVPFGSICVNDIEVGNLVPRPGTSPETVYGSAS